METLSSLLGFDVSTLLSGSSAILLAILFGAVFFLVVGISSLVRTNDPVQRRLAASVGAGTAGAPIPQRRGNTEQNERWQNLLKTIEEKVGLVKEEERGRLRRRMIQAGIMDPAAPRYYFAIRALLTIILPVAYLFAVPFVTSDTPLENILLTAALLAAIGLYGPLFFVSLKVSARQRSVREGFPDALDMLVVCVEAGLGFDAAFNRVGTQLERARPVVSWHFAMVALELRAGKSREDALRNFSARVGITEISSFVTLLIQSDALGTSIAQTLRVHADEMRDKRMMRAEEKAHMLPVLLSIPLVTCILPAMMTVVLLPGIIAIVRKVLPALSGN